MAFGKKGKHPKHPQGTSPGPAPLCPLGQPIYANPSFASTSALNPVPPYSPPYPPRPANSTPQQIWNPFQPQLPPSPQPSPPYYPFEPVPQPNYDADKLHLQQSKSRPNLATAVVQQPIHAVNVSVSNKCNKTISKTAGYWNKGAATGNAGVTKTTRYLNRGAALCDQIGAKFNDVISLMDEECFHGGENELLVTFTSPPTPLESTPETTRARSGGDATSKAVGKKASKGANQAVTSAVTSTNYFSKANLYANSRLPRELRPLRVYMPTWPLLCLAAQYSQRVYARPRGAEKETHVDADWRMGTKAMVIKSVPIDDMNTIVFAIRGSQTFMDWAVNLHAAPSSPAGFLDDDGNLCHAGFLDVAKKMVKPVAARLAQILNENPRRASASLVITGHSAGGAVASLLFCHMLSGPGVKPEHPELKELVNCFKRIHCVAFGAPPVSLLPLTKPVHGEERLQKSLFLSFINEFDPVPRADKAYVKSLVELYTSPAPKSIPIDLPVSKLASTSKLNLGLDSLAISKKSNNNRPKLPDRPKTAPAAKTSQKPSNITWEVPPATLSNAGRLVVLRLPYNGESNNEEDVRAYITSDEQLREVVFGDPLMHQMKVYARRIEILATKAVTGRLTS